MQWVGAAIALLLGLGGGYYFRRSLGEAKIGSAEAEAKRLLDEAVKAVDTKKREVLLEAKGEAENTRRSVGRESVRSSAHRKTSVNKEESLDRRQEP